MFQKEIGEIIPGLMIDGKPAPYGVLNEKAVRATAGILFTVGFFTLLTTIYTKNYFFMNIIVVSIFIDFFIKVFFGPKFSPTSLLEKLLVKNQTPEYVGAIQKRFAWIMGLGMSGIVLFFSMGLGLYGPGLAIFCSICLVFMWLESSIGYCVGCSIYAFLLKKGIIKTPLHKPKCAGNVCSL